MEFRIINDFAVCSIDRLAQMKAAACQSRGKLRDFHDLVFICLRHAVQLNAVALNVIRDAFSFSGWEQIEYLCAFQDDPLIDKSRLVADFLQACSRLGLRLPSSDALIDDGHQPQSSHHSSGLRLD